jgi:hypothetical protein
MPTSPKRPVKSQGEPPRAAAKRSPSPKKPAKAGAKSAAKTPTKPPASRTGPYLRFYHSESLRARSLAVLANLEEAEDPTKHRDALADLIVELTDGGMDYFFLRPLRLAKAGFITEQSANLGMAGSLRVMATVLRSVIGRMDDAQLLSVCSSIRELMR